MSAQDVKSGALTELAADGVFIAIGHAPATELILGQIKLKPSAMSKWRRIDRDLVPGVFAAATSPTNLPAAVTAAGLGCMAVLRGRTFSRPCARASARRRMIMNELATDYRYGLGQLKVFHAAAEAGSFTHAGEQLGLSQSAVSRQSAHWSRNSRCPLFHAMRAALFLTEQGTCCFAPPRRVHAAAAARAKLTDSRERPTAISRSPPPRRRHQTG